MDDVVLSFATNARRSADGCTFQWTKNVEEFGPSVEEVREVCSRGGKGVSCLHCGSSVWKKVVFRSVVNYDHFNGKMKFGPGVFCTPQCVLGYLEETRCSSHAIAYSKWALSEVYHTQASTVRPALPRCALKRYGGPLDIDNNREHSEIFFRGPRVSAVDFHDTVRGIPYAMVLEVQRATGKKQEDPDAALALSGKVTDLKRPRTREQAAVAQSQATGAEPLLLTKFAKMLLKEKDDKDQKVPKKTNRKEQQETPADRPEQQAAAAREQEQATKDEDEEGIAPKPRAKKQRGERKAAVSRKARIPRRRR